MQIHHSPTRSSGSLRRGRSSLDTTLLGALLGVSAILIGALAVSSAVEGCGETVRQYVDTLTDLEAWRRAIAPFMYR